MIEKKKNFIVAIDASRNRSGGAIAHIVGILTHLNPTDFGIDEVHIWSHRSLLERLPQKNWLHKHNPVALEKNLIYQILWQKYSLQKEFIKYRCSILLTTDAATFSSVVPTVTISQDMLPFDVESYNKIRWTKKWLRILILYYVSVSALKKSSGVVFLTKFVSHKIQEHTGQLNNIKIISHGVDELFRKNTTDEVSSVRKQKNIFRCLYISPVYEYKNQDTVVLAIAQLRSEGFNIHLDLIGGGDKTAFEKLNKVINSVDPDKKYVRSHDFLPKEKVIEAMDQSDIFIFASSCENMPITLMEAMSMGLPIACSNIGPMPEVLQKAGVYFDPKKPASIADAVRTLILDEDYREKLEQEARELSLFYTWKQCSRQTFDFIRQTWNSYGGVSSS